jgi:peptidoglycan/LPS O-acetylase OafA/YrhL
VICAFVIAPFFADRPAHDFLTSIDPFLYVLKVLLLLDPLQIRGVAFYNDAALFGGIINGSLWTLLQEAQFYVGILILAWLKVLRIEVALAGIVVGVALFAAMNAGLLDGANIRIVNLTYSLSAICSGIAGHFLVARLGRSRRLALACVAALVGAAAFGVLPIVFPVLAAYPLIHFGTSETIRLPNVARFGDVTYGAYLYGWPIQQLVRVMLGAGHSGWELFIISWPLALACGFASWHLLERRTTLAALGELGARFSAKRTAGPPGP